MPYKHLEEKDLQKLKCQVQHSWDKRALEKLLNLSHSNTLSELQESWVESLKAEGGRTGSAGTKRNTVRTEATTGRGSEEKGSRAEANNGDPQRVQPSPEKPLGEVMEDMQRQLNLMQGEFSHRKNLSDRELVRHASGGLALQGIYKTSDERCLIQKKEELLCVPKEFVLRGPNQGTWVETKEFTSSQEESMFTQTVEKLGFSVTALAKRGGWGMRLEAGMDQSMHSESKKIQQSQSKHSYFCSTKFICIQLASCIFPIDQLQLSNAALQGLKYIEDLLSQSEDPDKLLLLRHRTEAFFQRFGSHANQGPLHLGGIYWWKSISEGFQKEQLAEVKQQAAEALDIYIRGSCRGFGVNTGTDLDVSDSHSKKASQRATFQNLQTKVQFSVAQTGGPPEANDFLDWKAGLVANNQTWCVIDRGPQLVPVWDIVLSSHRSYFRDPLKVANCLKDNYTILTELTAQIQEGELLSIEREARIFLEDVKSWKVFDPEEQLRRLINFMQRLSQKTESYTIWTNICLKDWGLKNFLVNIVNFCKKSSSDGTKFIKSQLSSLLDPHIYTVTTFPQAHSIMQWIFQSEPREDNVHITQFSELIEIFKKTQNDLREVKANSESTELVEEAQRKLTYEVSLSLRSFLKYLRETGKPDTHILLLLIASGAGYHVVHNIFQYLLGHDELDFLLDKMQIAQNKHQELKNICNYRAQAFLVLTGLTTVGIKAVSPEEKTQWLALIKHHMGQSLTKEVVYVLTKPEDHDWENLEKGLRLLIDGNYEAIVSSLPVEEVRKQLQSVFHEKKEHNEPQDNENKKEEVTENGALQDLLERLGLEHYYPREMSRANIQLIHKTSVYNTQPCSERELPFYFVQKLLMLDYGLRYLIIKHEEYTENQVYSAPQIKKRRLLIHMKIYLKKVLVLLSLQQPLMSDPMFTLWIFRWQFFTVQMILPDNIFWTNFPFVSLHSPFSYLILAMLKLNSLSGLSVKFEGAGSKQGNQ
ncbi:unnamed protein product [Rangifer tarandus platyrhynchus]|uniref:Uncharacterized protein n=2 Tax=Rangifer tarandus platyrhynchus TaxID=3082113 RepID=A0AC59Y5J1_RANTA|nr:unnamed protein product [Rangifer tarandus platyrhynchus]